MILAIDTSTRHLGVALFDGHRVLSESTWTSAFHHTVELAPAVEQALARAGCSPSDLAAIGVATGPGSFTALRIGLALAKGLALAQGLPVLGIPSLDISAAGMPPSELPLLAVLESGRKRFAAGRYVYDVARWQPNGEPWQTTLEGLAAAYNSPQVVCGELDAQARAALSGSPNVRLASAAQCVRRPAVLAELAWARLQAGERDDPAALAPRYLAAETDGP